MPAAGSRSNTKLLRIDFGNDVIVSVGKDERRFVAHKDTLSRSSTFFQAAFSGEWLESKEKLVRMPEQDSTVFSIYLHWRYLGSIDLWDGEEETTSRIEPNEEARLKPGPRISRLIHCYVLGDMLGEPHFCNALIDKHFRDFVEQHATPNAETINLALESLSETSPLCQLFIHQVAFCLRIESFRSNLDRYSSKVIREITRASVEGSRASVEESRSTGPRRPSDRGRCFYHVHADGEKRCDS